MLKQKDNCKGICLFFHHVSTLIYKEILCEKTMLCLLMLILYIPVNIFSVMLRRLPVFLAQGHTAVTPVSLKPSDHSISSLTLYYWVTTEITMSQLKATSCCISSWSAINLQALKNRAIWKPLNMYGTVNVLKF